MGSKSRRKWSSKEKLRIVLAGMDGGVEVSELCRREGISPTQYYAWKNQLLQSSDQVYGRTKAKPDRQQQRLETDLTRAKDVIAEITSENLELKKTLSD